MLDLAIGDTYYNLLICHNLIKKYWSHKNQ